MTLTPSPRQEPQFSIRGFGGAWAEAAALRVAPHAVRGVENRGLDRPLGIGGPRIQLGPRNAYQAAGRVQPGRMLVVFHHPVNGIAGQSVLAGKCGNTAVFARLSPPWVVAQSAPSDRTEAPRHSPCPTHRRLCTMHEPDRLLNSDDCHQQIPAIGLLPGSATRLKAASLLPSAAQGICSTTLPRRK